MVMLNYCFSPKVGKSESPEDYFSLINILRFALLRKLFESRWNFLLAASFGLSDLPTFGLIPSTLLAKSLLCRQLSYSLNYLPQFLNYLRSKYE